MSSKPTGQPVVVTNATSNISTKIVSACESYPDAFWDTATIGDGDFILARGNTAGAGWIEISKDPYAADTETILPVAGNISMPIRMSILDSMTHRNAGEQTAAIEFLSDDAAYGASPLDTPVAVEILNASQTTSTITVNFATAPASPFRVGQVVSIYGFVDTRLNVNNATVASVVSDTSITVVGNDYTLTSTTITTTLGSGTAFIERVDQLGLARNGISYIHGNATNTNRRSYVRSQGGLARPSGTLASTHAFTTGTDTASAAANIYRAESFLAPLETVFFASRDGVTVADRSPDANAAITPRVRFTQNVPSPLRPYKLQFRVRATKSLTRPIAKIVSITKTASTTAVVVTDGPHGLVTGQYVGFYGVNNQTAFANQTTGLICTVIDATTFSVVHGSSTTATSYGGFVFRSQGQQLLGGAIAQVAQSVSRTSNIVTIIGNASWAAPTTIGNVVEVIGLRDTVTGDDLGLDGAYNVINISTTALTLEPVDGHAPTGIDVASVNCGGGVVQRLGYRIHRVMAVEYDPLMIEPAFKGNMTDVGEATQVGGTLAATQSGTWNVTTVSTVTAVTTAGTPPVPATPYFLNSAATTNGALILTGTSAVPFLHATNIGATAAFIKLYNKATAPTVGTDVPEMIIPVPAAVAGVPGVASIVPGYIGPRFPLGLGIAITGAVADTDTTAVAAGQVKVKLSRTV